MSDEGLGISLTDETDIREKLGSRKYWFFVVGANRTDMLDLIDEAIGAYPTHPTAMCPSQFGMHWITIVPKSRLSRRRAEQVLRKITKATVTVRPEQDVFMLPATGEEPAMVLFMEWLNAGVVQS